MTIPHRARGQLRRPDLKRSRFGEMLPLYRTAHGIGLRQIAHETGINHATLNRIERGHEMDASTLIKLVRWLFDVDRRTPARLHPTPTSEP